MVHGDRQILNECGPRCNTLVNATKHIQIITAPEVLALPLKRFTPTERGYAWASQRAPQHTNSTQPSHMLDLALATGDTVPTSRTGTAGWCFEVNNESVTMAQPSIISAAYILHYIPQERNENEVISAGRADVTKAERLALSITQRSNIQDGNRGPLSSSKLATDKRGGKLLEQVEQTKQPQET